MKRRRIRYYIVQTPDRQWTPYRTRDPNLYAGSKAPEYGSWAEAEDAARQWNNEETRMRERGL